MVKWYQKASVQVAMVSGVVLIIIAGINTWHNRSELKEENKKYKDRVDTLEQSIGEKIAEIQRLETLLTPFKTIALEKYTGSEQEVLQKLADKLQELKDYVNPLKKPIASATSHVEVTIKSDEQVSTKYMDVGGYLMFIKNLRPLLLTSDTESYARQNGKGEVVYTGEFKMQDEHSAVGKPIEILQTADLIVIEFVQLPKNSQVVNGKASVVINGDIRYEFEILPQQMQNKKIVISDIKNKFQ